MLLKELLADIPRIKVEGDTDVEVSGIACDSRKVKKGDLFVCLPGSKTDGHKYIEEAVSRGAVAVLMQEKNAAYRGFTAIKTRDPRRIISRLAAKYYGYPSRLLRLTGVTGTNGKTSTTHFIDHILSCTGPTGLIGTISYKIGSIRRPVEATTPEAPTLQEIFREMVNHKVRYCTMEVSSHALALNRVDDCDFNIAVLTNITEDHLDFHKTFTNYLQAKAALFKKLIAKEGNYAIINNDDSNASYIKRVVVAETVTYGIRNRAQVRAEAIEIKPVGVSFIVKSWAGTFPVHMQISGLFTVYNALAAVAVGLKEGIAPPAIKEALEKIPGIPGRFEQVQEGQDFYVIIDYAHTPDGLENILFSVQQFCRRKIITVFGCGGERDRSKRPLMGAVALKYSDYVIITNDNPRREPPGAILADILKGIDGSQAHKYDIILDRRKAIRRAVYTAAPGDVVLIAGKGHENYQVFAAETVPFSDKETAAYFIRERIKGHASGNEADNC